MMNEESKAAVETGAKPKSKAAPDAIAEEGEGGSGGGGSKGRYLYDVCTAPKKLIKGREVA